MFKRTLLCTILFLGLISAKTIAQELEVRLSVNTVQVSTNIDKKIFQTLQNALTNLLNNRKWTTETFQPTEKIVCHFQINIRESLADNAFRATLMVQAARPVYNSSYQSALINFQDESFVFKYVEYQPVDFNENRVTGSDPMASNLTATLAYYVYIILGLDFDSYSLRGGDPYFQKAQLIVNNAPEGRGIEGWRAFDGIRNRYWLMENLTNNRYTLFHDAFYSYYRLGLDLMYENEDEGRNAVMNTINIINTLNTDIPNSMIVQFFFQGRAKEIVRLMKKAEPDQKNRAREILSKIDITNSNLYKTELK